MRRISRVRTNSRPIVRVVFVDLLEQEMMDLKALRKEVADAETRSAPQVRQQLNLPRWRQPPFISGRLS